MQLLKKLLNNITMYRLVLYSLIFLSILGIIFALTELISYSPKNLTLTLANLIAVTFISNKLFGKIFKAPLNQESWIITALIIFLIITPASSPNEHLILAAIGAIAMLSKYLLTWRHKHIFNPAALAVFIGAIAFSYYAIWWVGSIYFFPATLIIALLVFAKIRRFHMLLSFLIATLITLFVFTQVQEINFINHLDVTLRSWPLFFLAGIMLTEPYTTPPLKKNQIIYGAIVAAISAWPFTFGIIYSSPELALLIGNVFTAIVAFQPRIILTLKEKIELTPNAFEFIFSYNKKPKHQAGQYMEWTLPHKSPDSRGVRRYFTIASEPNCETLKLGVKFNTPSSSFKKALKNLNINQKISVGEVDGNFLLPKENRKLCFIAGGIGITPFISQLRHLQNEDKKTDVILFYGNRSKSEIAYNKFLKSAEKKMKLKVIHAVGKERINASLIKKNAKDYRERIFYISGPTAMVDYFKKTLKEMGIKSSNIKTDYFPGFS